MKTNCKHFKYRSKHAIKRKEGYCTLKQSGLLRNSRECKECNKFERNELIKKMQEYKPEMIK